MAWTIGIIALAVTTLVLFLGTFNPAWIFSPWVKILFRLFAATSFSALTLMVLLANVAFPWRVFWALYSIQMLCLGASGCLLLLFFLSGEVKRVFTKWRKKGLSDN